MYTYDQCVLFMRLFGAMTFAFGLLIGVSGTALYIVTRKK